MSAEAIERALRGAETMGVAPGFVAVARLPDGATYEGAFGRRGPGDAAAMSADTLFWIASMTKLATSIAALQLVEGGHVGLDQDVGDLLATVRRCPILEGFDAAGAPVLRPSARPVTLRHLLTHTSGFGYVFMSPDLARYAAHFGLGLDQALALPRLFEAGERWQYGVSTDFVGQIVEALTAQGLDAYLKAHVFDRLGMSDTTFAPSPDQAARTATMCLRQDDGSLAPMPFAPPPPPNPMLGGGGLYSTAGDYLKLLTALLNGGEGLLTKASLDLLTNNQVGEIDCGHLESSHPMLTNSFKPMPEVARRWSLAMMRNETAGPHGRSAGSVAWAGLSNCYYWMDPSADAAGVLLMQILPFADARALDLFGAFERAVYA